VTAGLRAREQGCLQNRREEQDQTATDQVVPKVTDLRAVEESEDNYFRKHGGEEDG
jgi:hypothetical protein